MGYGKILFNNIKEYTPTWFRTIPYARTTKPSLVRQPYRGSAWMNSPMYKANIRLWREWVQKNPTINSMFIFGVAFFVVHVYWASFLKIYQMNNAHRQLDVAIEREKAYKATLPSDDDEDEDED